MTTPSATVNQIRLDVEYAVPTPSFELVDQVGVMPGCPKALPFVLVGLLGMLRDHQCGVSTIKAAGSAAQMSDLYSTENAGNGRRPAILTAANFAVAIGFSNTSTLWANLPRGLRD